MKKFTKIFSATVVLVASFTALAAPTFVGDGDLKFWTITDANGTTILTPVLQRISNQQSFGFYNLAGQAINADGSARTSDAPIDQSEIAARIAAQYTPSNAIITFPAPPLN